MKISIRNHVSIIRAILVALCLSCSLTLSAQTSGIIKGTVVDKVSVPIPNMNVALLGTGKNVTTDRNGHFVFTDIHPGSYSVQVSSVGFESQVRVVNVKEGETADVTFEIYEKISELEDVLVTGVKKSYIEPLSSVSTRTSIPLMDIA